MAKKSDKKVRREIQPQPAQPAAGSQAPPDAAVDSQNKPYLPPGSPRPKSAPTTALSRRALVIIALLFFASGASSLIYQVVWTRLLVLVFGATTFATATVLAIFMGGLALGSYFGGRYADRVAKPLLAYGVLELIIGAWALFVPFMFDFSVPIYRAIWQHWHMSAMPFSILRFIETAVILIVPTTCMGATLPILGKFVTDSLALSGKRIGSLYAVNTFGAISGAVFSGFFLLPAGGITFTIAAAAFINGLLFVAVLLVGKLPELVSGASAAVKVKAPEPDLSGNQKLAGTGATVWQTRAAIFSFALSGLIAMAYEVAWTRSLLMVVGSSTYAFTLMLSAFLSGIALGSWLCSLVVNRITRPLFALGLTQVALGILTLGSILIFLRVPYWNLVLNVASPATESSSMLVRFLLCFITLAPCTFCLGIIFPLVVQVCAKDLDNLGESVGTAYAANTIGAICGATLAGFVLLPALGSDGMITLGMYINIALGAILFLFSEVSSKTKLFAWLGAATLITAGLTYLPRSWDKLPILTAQQARRHLINYPNDTQPLASYESWLADVHKRLELVDWRNGTCSNVGVRRSKPGGHTSLVTNGHIDASDGTDMTVQVLLAGLPHLANPAAKSVAVVGWGSGVTLGTSALFPVESIEAIELEPAVVAMSKYFHHVNHSPENNDKIRIQYNDGRNYLLVTDKKYDIIISEPSNPWQSGVCNLFTRDYFQLAKDRLNKGGVFALWEQTSEVPTTSLQSVFSALTSVFPHVCACNLNRGNIVILASPDAIKFNPRKMSELYKNAQIAQDLKKVGCGSPDLVLARLSMAEDGIKAAQGSILPNSDNQNRLEFEVARGYENTYYNADNSDLLHKHPGDLARHIDLSGMTPAQTAECLAQVCQATGQTEDASHLGEYWQQAASKAGTSAVACRLLGQNAQSRGKTKEALAFLEKSLALDAKNLLTLEVFGNTLLDNGQVEKARACFQKMLTYAPNDKVGRFWMARSYTDLAPFGLETIYPGCQTKLSWEPEMVLKYLQGLPADKEFVREHHDVLFMAADAEYRSHHLPEAEKWLQEYLQLQPRSGSAVRMLGAIAYARGQRELAANYWQGSFNMARQLLEPFAGKARVYLERGDISSFINTLTLAQEICPNQTISISMAEAAGKKYPQAKKAAERLRQLYKIANPQGR